MKEEKNPVIVKFARAVKEATSYEEFFLMCMADDKMSALLNRLTAFYLAPGDKVAKETSPLELYKSLKSLVEDVDKYKGA